MASAARSSEKRYTEGRDEMNLADFPISVLQRQQPVDEQGVKRDLATYEASRYDPRTRQRSQQRVTLETSSRHGLPTPADENVILALLYVAKHAHDFTDPVVHFAPRQLFHIMGWAPNSRSYDRLRDVLRRLKALVIRYENSWWDIAGRAYEQEVATGIISEYELARQTGGPSKGAKVPPSWVRWTPTFQQSLANGNLKKLDLERLFALRLPTAQRMYRFLDKRFYQAPCFEMDLIDFACGHIGLTQVPNVAELKRRLAPAIAELEGIGFIAKADPGERYQKVRAGVWRVRFRAGGEVPVVAREADPERPGLPLPSPPPVREAANGPEAALVTEFYRRWDPQGTPALRESDLHQARQLLRHCDADKALAVIPYLVQVVKRKWPECKSLSGAADKYWGEAVAAYDQGRRRDQTKQQAQLQRQRELEDQERQAAEQRQREAAWQALPESRRQEIEQEVLRRNPEHRARPAILKVLCLSQLAQGELR